MSSLNPVIVPLNAVASQTLDITLGGQNCTINVYGKTTYVPFLEPNQIPTTPPVYGNINPVFVDLYVNNVLIIGGVLGRNQVLIVRDTYLGFSGDLIFTDTQGTDDPLYQGLGTRWLLLYLPTEP